MWLICTYLCIFPLFSALETNEINKVVDCIQMVLNELRSLLVEVHGLMTSCCKENSKMGTLSKYRLIIFRKSPFFYHSIKEFEKQFYKTVKQTHSLNRLSNAFWNLANHTKKQNKYSRYLFFDWNPIDVFCFSFHAVCKISNFWYVNRKTFDAQFLNRVCFTTVLWRITCYFF